MQNKSYMTGTSKLQVPEDCITTAQLGCCSHHIMAHNIYEYDILTIDSGGNPWDKWIPTIWKDHDLGKTPY